MVALKNLFEEWGLTKILPSFPREVQSGVLEVISPPASYYPDLSNLKETLGDSEDRVR